MEQGELRMNSEPALTIGGATAVVQAGVAALVAGGGFSLSDKQEGAIIAFATLAIGLLSAIVVRMHVFSPATVDKIVSGQAVTNNAASTSLGAGGTSTTGGTTQAAADAAAAFQDFVTKMAAAKSPAMSGGKG
jgi:hypothetical protein